MGRRRILTDAQCAEVMRRRRIRWEHYDKRIAADLGVSTSSMQQSVARWLKQQPKKGTP